MFFVRAAIIFDLNSHLEELKEVLGGRQMEAHEQTKKCQEFLNAGSTRYQI